MSYKEYTVRVFDTGIKIWFLNGNLHREDGPTVEYSDGTKFWYLNNNLHREDGPAVERANGKKYWYLNGKELTEQEFKDRMKEKNTCDGKVVEIDGVKYQLTIVE